MTRHIHPDQVAANLEGSTLGRCRDCEAIPTWMNEYFRLAFKPLI